MSPLIFNMVFEKKKIRLRNDTTNTTVKVKAHRLPLDMYNIIVDVVFGQEKLMEQFKDVRHCSGYTRDSGDGIYLVWVRDKKSLGTVVHELYHLVNMISKTVGLSEDYNNEQQAYLLGWLFKEVRKLK